MTREEAILKIEYIRDGNDFTPTDAQVKAMNMAIEALSARDMISRAELFNKLAVINAPMEACEYKAEVYKIINEL